MVQNAFQYLYVVYGTTVRSMCVYNSGGKAIIILIAASGGHLINV